MQLKCIGNNNECLNMINNTYLVSIYRYFKQINMTLTYFFICQFYLALENSLCRDYITEKFWKVLPFDIIPVVLNGLNMSKIAPPHSYIDIKEFKSFSGEVFHFAYTKSTFFQPLLCTCRESQEIHHFLPPIFGGRIFTGLSRAITK